MRFDQQKLAAALFLPLVGAWPYQMVPRQLPGMIINDLLAGVIQDINFVSRIGVSLSVLTPRQFQIPFNNLATLQAENLGIPIQLPIAESTAYNPFIRHASAAYCAPSTIGKNFTCGPDCAAAPGFQVVDQGVNKCDVPWWYVGWDPRNLAAPGTNPSSSNGTIIVSHQGTFSTAAINQLLLTDQSRPNTTLFPGVPAAAGVHQGFLNVQARSADAILADVIGLIRSKRTTNVITVGHSLGAVVALLDAVSLQGRLKKAGITATVSSITLAMPRPGNPAFADYAEGTGITIRHVNNGRDPVPVVLAMDYKDSNNNAIKYRSVKGELHINRNAAAGSTGTWYNCPGRDNPSNLCAVGIDRIGNTGPSAFDLLNLQANRALTEVVTDLEDHGGPFNPNIPKVGTVCTVPQDFNACTQ